MRKLMTSVATTLLTCGMAFAPLAAASAGEADNAASQKAKADCKAQVKQYAQYHETSWYQRHKMLKKCINDALSGK